MSPNPNAKAASIGLICALLFVLLQWFAVAVHYQGQWSALFCTGGLRPFPPSLAGENIYRFPEATGYDGQFYHYMAHDPFFQRDLVEYMDHPRLRYRRILVPALAHALTLGRQDYIDAAYFAVLAGFVVLGGYWLALYAHRAGYSLVWGLAFVAVPGVLVSANRMTIDVALVALCAAYVLHAEQSDWRLYLILALAVLARDTGLLLLAGHCTYLLLQRSYRKAALCATAAAPAWLWMQFVHQHAPHTTAELSDWAYTYPIGGFLFQLLHPNAYPSAALVWQALDLAALLSMVVLVALILYRLVHLKTDLLDLHLYLWLLLVLILASLGPAQAGPYWQVFSYGRSLSPLLFFQALYHFQRNGTWRLALVGVISIRVALDIAFGTGVENL